MTDETDADVIMWAAAKHAEADKARYAAVKQKLRISTFNGLSDLDLARAWRDLGFPLKRFMREMLRSHSEPLFSQQPPPIPIQPITEEDFKKRKEDIH